MSTDKTPDAKIDVTDSDTTELKKSDDSKSLVLQGHLAKIYGDWMKTHRGSKPPLYVDMFGNPVWLNRKERRARAKQARTRK